jgi:hypothetical protein
MAMVTATVKEAATGVAAAPVRAMVPAVLAPVMAKAVATTVQVAATDPETAQASPGPAATVQDM